jgi:GcrA cell cycle regulator
VNAVVELLKADASLTYAEVAEKFGVGFHYVRGLAKRARKRGELSPRCENGEWPTDRVETLKAMWAQGLPTLAISKALGVTRNAVIGKAHRLDLKSRKKGQGAGRPRKIVREKQTEEERTGKARERMQRLRRQRAAADIALGFAHKPAPLYRALRPAPSRTRPSEPPPAPDMLMLSIFDLEPSSCRFPIGDPKQPGFAFCGVKHNDLGSYCAFHRHLAYQPPESRRRQSSAINYAVKRYA